jgi:transcriptional regulator with XRE-family HTH domain
MPTVGDKIKRYRLEKGMTQEDLGKELGVGKAAVQKYESDQVQNLKSAHIKRLCELFDKTPWDFIFDGEQATPAYDSLEKTSALRKILGEDVVNQLLPLTKLNGAGLTKIKEYALDLAKIDEYKR